jgi:hypothetical protein
MRGGKHVKVIYLRTLYDCSALCQRHSGSEGNDAVRAAYRCSLPGFDPARWDPAAHPESATDAERMAESLQGQAVRSGIALDWDLDRDGCPRGWADSFFGGSVMRYAGARSRDSHLRTLNALQLGRILRDEEPPTRLLELVRYGEAAEDNAYEVFRQVVNSS